MFYQTYLSFFLILVLAMPQVSCQDLERRAFLGIRLSPIADSLRQNQSLPSEGGIYVQQVFAQSSASAAGIQSGDLLWTLGGKEIEGSSQFLSLLRTYNTGDKVSVAYSRNGQQAELELTLLPFPEESYKETSLHYGSVQGPLGKLRTILTLPKNPRSNPPPVVYLIQGIDCGSIDIPFNSQSSFAQIIRTLSEAGYASFRVEKSGVGDSKGKACRDCDFEEDKEGFAKGLQYLKSLPQIDPEKVYIFGLSMGGVWGPLIAREEPIAGLAVYGTISRPWMEYMLENSRRQAYLANESPGNIEAQLKQDAQIYHHWFNEGKTPSEIIDLHPEYEERLRTWASRSNEEPLQHMHADRLFRFQTQLQGINLSETWQNLDTHVLVMWGKGDYVSNQEDHQLIAHIVNRRRPGKAMYVEVEADHFFNTASNEKEAYLNLRRGNPGPTNPVIFKELIQWLEKVDNS